MEPDSTQSTTTANTPGALFWSRCVWLLSAIKKLFLSPFSLKKERYMSLQEEDGSWKICVICRDEMTKQQNCSMLPRCGHIYHKSCLQPWLEEQPVCPQCKAPVAHTPAKPRRETVTPSLPPFLLEASLVFAFLHRQHERQEVAPELHPSSRLPSMYCFVQQQQPGSGSRELRTASPLTFTQECDLLASEFREGEIGQVMQRAGVSRRQALAALNLSGTVPGAIHSIQLAGERAQHNLMMLTGVSQQTARDALQASSNSAPLALFTLLAAAPSRED